MLQNVQVELSFKANFSCWLISGADYESLFTEQNLKLGVTASALSVAMSLGLKKVGNTNSASSMKK